MREVEVRSLPKSSLDQLLKSPMDEDMNDAPEMSNEAACAAVAEALGVTLTAEQQARLPPLPPDTEPPVNPRDEIEDRELKRMFPISPYKKADLKELSPDLVKMFYDKERQGRVTLISQILQDDHGYLMGVGFKYQGKDGEPMRRAAFLTRDPILLTASQAANLCLTIQALLEGGVKGNDVLIGKEVNREMFPDAETVKIPQ